MNRSMPLWYNQCRHPTRNRKESVNKERSVDQEALAISVAFETSEFYRYEQQKFHHKNKNRGMDKVSIFNKYDKVWAQDRFLSKVHRRGYQTNESREGRKLDVSGYMAKTRPFTA